MSRFRFSPRLSPERWRQLQGWALAALALLLALGATADVSVDRPRGPDDWQQRVIVLLPGVCAQPAALPPTPNLPAVPLVDAPDQWPTWPGWLTCGGEHATQNARARALATFVGGYGSQAQLTRKLNQALENDAADNPGDQNIAFTIRA